jgi:hypothetical protein
LIRFCSGFLDEGFLAGDGEPAAVAVSEDIGEADFGFDGAVRQDHGVEAADVADVSVDVGMQIAQLVGTGLALRKMIEHDAAAVDGAVRAVVFEVVGEDAGERGGIVGFEAFGPGVFDVNEGVGSFGVFGAIGGEEGQGKKQEEDWESRH